MGRLRCTRSAPNLVPSCRSESWWLLRARPFRQHWSPSGSGRVVAACLGTLDLWTARQSADQALDLVFLLERTTGFEPATLTLARHGSSELKCSRVP